MNKKCEHCQQAEALVNFGMIHPFILVSLNRRVEINKGLWSAETWVARIAVIDPNAAEPMETAEKGTTPMDAVHASLKKLKAKAFVGSQPRG